MKNSQSRRRLAFLILSLAVIAALLTPLASAQEVGGEIRVGAGIFKPKNPETNSKRRTGGAKSPATTRSKSPANSRVPRTQPAPTATDVEDQFEDALDEGNEARTARKFDEAEKAYRAAAGLKPNDARAAYGLANIYTDQQRWAEAEQAYRRAIMLNSRDPNAYLALSFVLVQPWVGGNLARRYVDAEQFARRSIELQPLNPIAHDQLGQALEARGITGSEAEETYRRAIALDTQYAVAYLHLAHLLRRTNRASDAEPLYQKAIELAKDPAALIFIAEVLQSEQRWDDSEPILRRALSQDARNPAALLLLGRKLAVRRNFAEAESVLKTAIEVSPRSFLPYVILGDAYLRMERFEDAEKIFNSAAEFASAEERKRLAESSALGGVGDGYLKAGRVKDAVRVYERALSFDPNNKELQSKLGEARSRGE